MTAEEYLSKVKVKYSNLKNYRDTGVAGSASGEDHRVTFNTDFNRHSYYKVQYTIHSEKIDECLNHLIYSDFNTLKLEGDWEKFQKIIDTNTPNSLPDIIACTTGISWGATHSISALLMDNVGGFRITDIKEPEFVGDIDTVTTITGNHPWVENCQITVVFDDMLIQSIERQSEKYIIKFKPEIY